MFGSLGAHGFESIPCEANLLLKDGVGLSQLIVRIDNLLHKAPWVRFLLANAVHGERHNLGLDQLVFDLQSSEQRTLPGSFCMQTL